MKEKKFTEPDNTAVFTTKFVMSENQDITLVTHEKDDGAWQFFSDEKFDDYTEVAMLVGLGQIVKKDSTLLELADMPVGFSAMRKFKGDKWVIQEVRSAD